MTTNSSFLPADYSIPEQAGPFMKLEDGQNRFRILGSPALGWIWWEDTPEGRKSHRVPYGSAENRPNQEAKHFWLIPVWNYNLKAVQMLEIAQKTLQEQILTFINDQAWGNPRGYDLAILKSGRDLSTKYQVMPQPHRQLPDQILAEISGLQLDPNAVFDESKNLITRLDPRRFSPEEFAQVPPAGEIAAAPVAAQPQPVQTTLQNPAGANPASHA